MSDTTEHSGAMVALVPTEADLDRLALEGGEPREELHLTLAYLGDAVEVPPEARDALEAGVREAFVDLGPVAAKAFGVAQWNPDGPEPAWVLNVGDDPNGGSATLDDAHDLVEEVLEQTFPASPDQHSPWQPHVCLAYSSDDLLDQLVPRLGPVTFDRVRIAFGGDVRDVDLSSPATVPPAEGGDEMTASVEDRVDEGAEDALVAASDCGAGYHRMPDGSCMSDAEMAAAGRWRGPLIVEGVETGDGREFSPNALTWLDSPTEAPMLLRWQKEGSHGGEHDVTVSVGRIDRVQRVNGRLIGQGTLDLMNPDGFELYRRMKGGYAGGISVDADDIADADIEFVWADEPDASDEDGGNVLQMLFGRPEKVIYHGGRIRAATCCDIPAFVEACISLVGDEGGEEALVAAPVTVTLGAVGTHSTATSDGPWDKGANETKLGSPMSVATARSAYAWIDTSQDSGGEVPKSACKFLHHDVDADGKPGAANLTACSAGIGVLNGARSAPDIPVGDKRGVYSHLARHLRDGGRTPPPARFEADAVLAAADLWRPDRSWFDDPRLSVPTDVTVTADLRVYGHAAWWGECHIGQPDVCVTPPEEDYHPYFMTGEVLCADGSRVAVGQVTVGIGHAPLYYDAHRATEHYDNTTAAVADVAVGNDEHGIWVAGAVRPYADAARIHDLRASGRVSGDWRRIGGQLRLVGLLAVNVGGFQKPALRTRVASGQQTALVAAGRQVLAPRGHTPEELERIAMRRVMDGLAARVTGGSDHV